MPRSSSDGINARYPSAWGVTKAWIEFQFADLARWPRSFPNGIAMIHRDDLSSAKTPTLQDSIECDIVCC